MDCKNCKWEEIKSVNDYIRSISKQTGVNIFDFMNESQMDYAPDCPFCRKYGTEDCVKSNCTYYKTELQKCYLRESCDHYGDRQVCGRCRHYNLYSHTKTEPQTEKERVMQLLWNENSQDAIKELCRLAHDNRVDITITFTHDGGAEVKVEPTYWDTGESQTDIEIARAIVHKAIDDAAISDFGGGLDRTVTVYTADGEVLKTYKGRIDLETTEGGIVKFDLNGQRIMYYNCYVEVIENVKETE